MEIANMVESEEVAFPGKESENEVEEFRADLRILKIGMTSIYLDVLLTNSAQVAQYIHSFVTPLLGLSSP